MRLCLIALATLSVAACGEPAPETPEAPPAETQAFEPTNTPDGNNLAPALEAGGDANPANTATEPDAPPATP